MKIVQIVLLALSIWVALLILITPSLEIFFVLLLLGILVERELIEGSASSDLKEKMNLFIYMFLIVFFFIVIKKVYGILSQMG